MNVFLSYARKDGDSFAARLRTELSSAGLVVWRDIEALVGTDDWRDQIRDAVFKVDAVVLLLTPDSVASQYVTLEWELALALQKPVLTALCLPCDIPAALAGRQYRDLSQPSIYTREVVALTRDLEGVKEAARGLLLKELSALREDDAFGVIHQALESLQRWLNGGVYETKIISAVVWLLRQMNVDSGSGRPFRALIGEAVEGKYIQPAWGVYGLFAEQRPIFEYILIQLSKYIKDESPGDGVPIVLVVMNEAEVLELIQGSAFEGYPEELRTDFDELQSILVTNGVGEWTRCYRQTADEWRPFAARGSEFSVRQLVEEVLGASERGAPAFTPFFIDVRTLDSNRWLLMKLRNEGCVVIVDSISMRHPAIQRAFQQSLLDAYPKTSVVNLAPIQSAFELVRKMRVFLRLQVSDLEFDKRRRYRFEEYGGCREIHERDEFEQWLSDRVGRMFPPNGEQRKGARTRMFERPERRG